jgi:hypothetical protein
MIAPRARDAELPKVPADSDSQMLRFFLRYAYAAVATMRQPLQRSLDTPVALTPLTVQRDCMEGSKWFKPRQRLRGIMKNWWHPTESLSLGRDITHDEPRLSVGVGQRDSWMLMKIHDIAR